MEGKAKQDRLLVAKLQCDKRIPIPFIAMLTVLVRAVCPCVGKSCPNVFNVDWTFATGILVRVQS